MYEFAKVNLKILSKLEVHHDLDVIKRSRKLKGDLTLSKNYYLRYRFDPMPAPKLKPLGVTSKEVAWQMANDFRREFEAEKAIIPPRSIRAAEAKSIESHLKDYR